MDSCRRLTICLLIGITFNLARGENALTDEEIAILRANNFTVTMTTDTITFAHHGLPEHASEGGWGNSNNATAVNYNVTLPRQATVSEPKGCAGGLGAIGVAVSGGAFFNPYNAFGWNAVEGQCKEELDTCYGHPTPDGIYHYHGLPDCLYTGELRNKFLGVALDGYPIYCPMDETGKNWTTAELDQCHGHYYMGRYMYRATYEFPYILSCYHGNSVKANQQGGGAGGGNMPPPPPGRRRRRAVDHDLYHRQAQGPPGHENDPCFTSDIQNWSDLTCFVVCENAGRDLSNCVNGTQTGGSVTPSTTATVLVIGHPYREVECSFKHGYVTRGREFVSLGTNGRIIIEPLESLQVVENAVCGDDDDRRRFLISVQHSSDGTHTVNVDAKFGNIGVSGGVTFGSDKTEVHGNVGVGIGSVGASYEHGSDGSDKFGGSIGISHPSGLAGADIHASYSSKDGLDAGVGVQVGNSETGSASASYDLKGGASSSVSVPGKRDQPNDDLKLNEE